MNSDLPSPTPAHSQQNLLSSLTDLLKTVHQLRAPGGCPWDRAQTHQTLRPFLIEEAYEVLDVLDQVDTDDRVTDPVIAAPFKEELGDLLMQVLLHSEMASERGAFNFVDVAQGLNDKLIRRHPHVFDKRPDTEVSNADGAFKNWEKVKAKEKKDQTDLPPGKSKVLSGLPKNLPALQKATRVIEKVTKVGFQWPDLQGPLQKIDEELGELRQELNAIPSSDKQALGSITEAQRQRLSSELGDLLFCVCNIAHFLGVSAEDALRGNLERFERRFSHVEKGLDLLGKTPEQSDLEEMDRLWNEAKAQEKISK